jgi:hypothetical protein
MKYYRIILGKANSHFEECFQNSSIGMNFDFNIDLSEEKEPQFFEQNGWKQFNRKYRPIYGKMTGNTSQRSLGLDCAKIWQIRYEMNIGDTILCPDGKGNYFIAEITSDYTYLKDVHLNHTRSVKWLGKISKNIISTTMKNSIGAAHTLLNITKYKDEIDNLLKSLEPTTNLTIKKVSEDNSDRVLLYQITDKSLGLNKLNVYNDFNDMQLVYELEDCEEFTYIMFDRAHDTIKIGKTKNDPELRLAQLRTANPSIQLLHTFPSSLYSEKDLHNKFYDHLKDLEWYYYARGVRKFITDESEKHKKILEAYKKRAELDNLESDIFESLKLELEDI